LRSIACGLLIAVALAAASSGCTDSMTTNVPEVEQDGTAARQDEPKRSFTDQVGGAPKRTIDRAKAAAKALEKKGARDDEQVQGATE
jgi:hypothetical protein